MAIHSSIRRARRQKGHRMTGFVVTWDVDSADAAQCVRLRRFVYGYTARWKGRSYRYPGLVERDGVRYLGQSVLFVTPERLAELRVFLRANRIDHQITEAWIGTTFPG